MGGRESERGGQCDSTHFSPPSLLSSGKYAGVSELLCASSMVSRVGLPPAKAAGEVNLRSSAGRLGRLQTRIARANTPPSAGQRASPLYPLSQGSIRITGMCRLLCNLFSEEVS